jgi:acyl-CoA synthetase (NDP forming)
LKREEALRGQPGKRRDCTATADGAAVKTKRCRKETKSTPISIFKAKTSGPSLEETVRNANKTVMEEKKTNGDGDAAKERIPAHLAHSMPSGGAKSRPQTQDSESHEERGNHDDFDHVTKDG